MTATPPHPIGTCRPPIASPVMLGGAARPLHQTGKPVATTASASRVALSVTQGRHPAHPQPLRENVAEGAHLRVAEPVHAEDGARRTVLDRHALVVVR